jgi:hypothetical protein
MADVVNRIVSRPLALDRASWQSAKRQRKRAQGDQAESLAADEPLTTAPGASAEPAPKDAKADKGKHLDLSV